MRSVHGHIHRGSARDNSAIETHRGLERHHRELAKKAAMAGDASAANHLQVASAHGHAADLMEHHAMMIQKNPRDFGIRTEMSDASREAHRLGEEHFPGSSRPKSTS